MTEYYKLAEVAKAVAAGVTAFVGSLAKAFADGQLDGVEIGGIVAATIVATGLVFSVPNADK